MTLPRPTALRATLALSSALVFVSCGGGDSPTDNPPPPATPSVGSVTFLSSPGEKVVGSAVSLEVRVDNTSGQPMAGQAVTFSATAGTVSPSSATTSAAGTATVSWTLGTTVGTQTLTATASGRSATASATATAGPAATFEKVSGDAQSGAAGEQLGQALVVAVKDQFGNARAGEALTVAVTSGGGSVGAASATTGSDGRASVAWILGEALGANALSVTHALGAVTFNATSVPGAPASVTAVSGGGQTGPAGAELADPVVVEVKDRLGHKVPGAKVAFVAVSGGGKASSDTVATDAAGRAQARWTLGSSAGAQTLEARAGSAPAAAFQATAVAGPASGLKVLSGDAQNGTVGQPLGAPVVVAAVDAFGNPVPGRTLTFATAAVGAKVEPGQVTTGADGRATVTWTLGTVAGAQSLTASSQGLAQLTVTAQAAAGAAVQVRAAAGSGQSGTVGQALASPLVAEAVDAFGNKVAGVTVTFAPSAGTVTPTSGATGADGRVSTTWTLGTTSGSPTVSATATGATAATFSATAAPGPAKTFAKVSGDTQKGPAQSPLAFPLVVMAKDTFGNGVPGVAVTFSVTGGGGSLAPAAANTGADGTASTVFTLGTAVGAHAARASAGALGTLDFTATATSGPPAALSKPSGDAQTRTAGDTVTVTVEVVDAFGNKVPSAGVTFTVASGGGSVEVPAPLLATTANGATGENGRASAVWTLGTTAGAQTLTAAVTGAGSVTFNATATAGPATSVTKVAGDNQTATVGTAVATDPRVKVADAFGNGVAGVSVTFAVASGGGSVSGSTPTTGADGTAAVGSWTLGAVAGANTLTATVTGLTPVTFTATGSAAPPATFDVEIRVIGSMSGAVQAAFAAAETRWESIITGDLPNTSLTATQVDDCSDDTPAEALTVDDLVIYAKVGPIDGAGGTLGSAGPCYIRSSTGIPILGTMTFDEADLASMQASGTLNDVILHEMGHVIGIGTIWEIQSLLEGKGGADPFFNGANGKAAFVGMGGTLVNGVPVENTGGEGTRDGHWRESVFGTELMTGFISGAGNPLSLLTVRSLADQGYTVNDAAADGYALPAPTAAPDRSLVSRGAWERLLKPIGVIDPDPPGR